ncbi:MAG: TetR/AcrR family transcriptional regulator [Naasia sp.]
MQPADVDSDASEQEERRRGLSGSVDQRATRTRERVVAALGELLTAGDPISVPSICARAEVGRSTFYTHFATINDVVFSVVDAIFDDLGRRDSMRRSGRTMPRRLVTELGVHELFEELAARRAFFVYALSAPAAMRLRDRFTSAVAASVRRSVLAERPDADEMFVRTASHFIAGGFVGVLLGWIDEERELDAEALARDLIELLPPWMTVDEPLAPPRS